MRSQEIASNTLQPSGQDSGPRNTRSGLLTAAGGFLLLAAAAILAALGFEHIGGYQPCVLCLMQRTPYYVAIPLAMATTAAVRTGASRRVLVLLFAVLAALAVYNTGLAIYHSGVEWALWEGPASCAPTTEVTSVADMLNQLENAHAPSCTVAPWRLLGLSFAGWNAIVSAGLAAIALWGLARSRRLPA